jgi:hypothetical protein
MSVKLNYTTAKKSGILIIILVPCFNRSTVELVDEFKKSRKNAPT